jgi:metal-responsive CopG/Arc/MetJ family transcriptional regulator
MHNPRNGGRKPKGDRPKTKINITLDSDLLRQVDERATEGRSAAIERLLRAALAIESAT